MKSMVKQLKKRKRVIFLDLEGTQFSHEMIALGAIRVELDRHSQIKRKHKGIKFYVKPKNKIGSYVTKLTGITHEIVEREGLSFQDALKRLKRYCGHHLSQVVFMTFGNHDLRIIMKSLENSPDADNEFCHFICHNTIDVSATISQYVKDKNGNPLSLIHNLEVFEVPLVGDPHDPLIDAKHLMLLYDAMMKKSDILFQEYRKVLYQYKGLPDPVRYAVRSLIDGNNVTSDEFAQKMKEYID